MGLIAWLATAGFALLGIAASIWGLTEFPKAIAIWGCGAPGAALLVIAACLELQGIANRSETTENDQMRLRAYLTVVGEVVQPLTAEKPVVVQVTIKNVGATPAHKVRTLTSVAAASFPLTEPFPGHLQTNVAEFVLAPAQEVYPNVPLKRVLTEHELDLIRAGKAAIYVFGDITYEDEFGKEHKCSYEFYYGGDRPLRADGAMTLRKSDCD